MYIKPSRLAETVGICNQTIKNHIKKLGLMPIRSSVRGNILLTKDQSNQILNYIFNNNIPDNIKSLFEFKDLEPKIKNKNNKK